MKPGYKTTEFWLSLAAVVIGAAAASGAFPDESGVGKVIGILGATLAGMGYTVSRGNVKKAEAPK